MEMKIKNFTGMGDNGLYYLEGMSPRTINNKKILTPTWYGQNYISENTTNFSAFTYAYSMDSISFNKDDASDLGKYLISINTGGKIFASHYLMPQYHIGNIHSVTSTGSGTDQIFISQKPSIKTTLNNNIIYSSAHHLGLGLLGKVKTGSGTTSIIDDAGRDLTTFGISTSAGSNIVYNLNNKESYTITSITTTNSTNDTLNFTAGTANNAGDYFMAFVDNRFKFGVSNNKGLHFGDQNYPQYWNRQIKIWDNYIWILNGNYLSRVGIDDTAWTSDVLEENAKQLPYLTQAVCMEINQGRMLVGGEIKDKGRLMLTDGWSDGWISTIELDTKPSSIIPFGSGWVVLVDSILYYTNGYSLQRLDSFPEKKTSSKSWSVIPEGMITINDKILINVNSSKKYTRKKAGVIIYDINTGWEYTPLTSNDNSSVFSVSSNYAGAIFYDGNYIYASSQGDQTPNINYINKISDNGGTVEKSVIFYIDLPKKMTVTEIGLKVSPKLEEYGAKGNVDVTVNVGEGKIPFWRYTQAGTGSTTTLIKHGLASSGWYGQVGQEIRFLEGVTAGERSYITSIANAGTSTEEWTISPALSTTPTTNADINIFGLKKTEKHTINCTDIPDEIPFVVNGFWSDKLFLEIVLKSADEQELDIYEVTIYGK